MEEEYNADQEFPHSDENSTHVHVSSNEAEAGPRSSSEVDRVKRGLLDMIRECRILPGQRLDQRRLAKELDSTTAPLREALSSLEAEQVLVRERGLGFFCRAYTVDEVEDLVEVRSVLEGLAARRAARRITPEALQELRVLAETLANATEMGPRTVYAQAHERFHDLVIDLAGSAILASLIRRNYLIESFIGHIAPIDWETRPQDHLAIVEAMASGDPIQAAEAMRLHISPPEPSERITILRRIYGTGPILSPSPNFPMGNS